MFYIFSYTPDVNDKAATPKLLPMHLQAGVIHQVDVLFQDGCTHKEFVQILLGGTQLWPTNREEKMRGNATVVSFREFFELKPGASLLTAKIWSTLDDSWKEIIIQIGLLSKRAIQPLSFDELLAAAKGMV